jgi:FtsZ-binding cell division protein ZapB
MDLLDQDTDSLASLEERVLKAVELVTRLRREKEVLVAERQAAVREAAEARAKSAELVEELEALRAERKQVRTRVEKLLSQIDQLAAG